MGKGLEQTTREKLIQQILDKQLSDGGWALSGTKSDPDMTAMAIQALAPYYEKNSGVETAVEKALQTLSTMQGRKMADLQVLELRIWKVQPKL